MSKEEEDVCRVFLTSSFIIPCSIFDISFMSPRAGPFDAVVVLGGGVDETPAGAPQLGSAGDRLEAVADGMQGLLPCKGSLGIRRADRPGPPDGGPPAVALVGCGSLQPGSSRRRRRRPCRPLRNVIRKWGTASLRRHQHGRRHPTVRGRRRCATSREFYRRSIRPTLRPPSNCGAAVGMSHLLANRARMEA
jgi:hypothetical protein